MSDDLDRLVPVHLVRMPDPTRQLLKSHIWADAPDAWLRYALMAYLRYFTRLFELEEPRESAESTLATELNTVTGREPSGDDDADVEAAEAELAAQFADRSRTPTSSVRHRHCSTRTRPA